MRKAYEVLISIGTWLQPLFLLAVRLFWGWQFFSTGLGKLQDLDSIAAFFGQLNIPYPLFNAYLVGITETVGGFCLLIGFASRLVSIPLMIAMAVALWTAHHEAVLGIFENSSNFISKTPFTFLFAALLIFIFGPGPLSVDGFIKRIIAKRKILEK